VGPPAATRPGVGVFRHAMPARPVLLAPLLGAAVALAAPAASPAAVVIDGHGFGHGIGMSQYGAYGYALREGRDAPWILGHYYPGTTLGSAPATRIRVLLKGGSSQAVSGATRVRDATGRRIALRERRTYRVRPAAGGALRVTDARTRRSRGGALRAPLRFTGGTSTVLRGTATGGVSDGEYRGAMQIVRSGSSLLAINDVALRQYLFGVVPAEMPTAWSIEAVKAQAIVARSYAIRGLTPGRAFDVYADTRSQVYRGVRAETFAGTQAVLATDGLVVRYGDEVAQTFFHSTSGGRTANNEEVFGGAPIAYLRSVDDAQDDVSPLHAWTETLSDGVADARLGDLVAGRLTGLTVTGRGPSGRVLQVAVEGTEGTRTATGVAIRTRLRLRSTWFEVREAR
jgi:stage II sporulation protein D